MNVTVEDATSNFSASKTICEVSVISDVTNNSSNASHASSSSVHAFFMNSEIRSDAVAFKIFINTVNTVLYEKNQTLNVFHVSIFASLIIFANSISALSEKRLVSSSILF